ncbi:hypothetical protein Ciccas_001014, partial [Cichlidogyrus casuarinus]
MGNDSDCSLLLENAHLSSSESSLNSFRKASNPLRELDPKYQFPQDSKKYVAVATISSEKGKTKSSLAHVPNLMGSSFTASNTIEDVDRTEISSLMRKLWNRSSSIAAQCKQQIIHPKKTSPVIKRPGFHTASSPSKFHGLELKYFAYALVDARIPRVPWKPAITSCVYTTPPRSSCTLPISVQSPEPADNKCAKRLFSLPRHTSLVTWLVEGYQCTFLLIPDHDFDDASSLDLDWDHEPGVDSVQPKFALSTESSSSNDRQVNVLSESALCELTTEDFNPRGIPGSVSFQSADIMLDSGIGGSGPCKAPLKTEVSGREVAKVDRVVNSFIGSSQLRSVCVYVG